MEIGRLREEIAKRAAAYEMVAAKSDDAAKTDAGPASGDAAAGAASGACHPARAFYQRLQARIARVEASLKPTEGLELTHDVPDGHCHIEQLGYDQDMIIFTGHLASGRRCCVYLNVHAVNLCLTVSPLPAGETRQRVTFRNDAGPDA